MSSSTLKCEFNTTPTNFHLYSAEQRESMSQLYSDERYVDRINVLCQCRSNVSGYVGFMYFV